jgi:HTH-type transcriptional regulator / antitoxin HigA
MEAVRPIKTEQQYREALKKIDTLIDAQPDTTEFEFLEVLSILVDDYENKHYAIEPLDPIEAIKYEMGEQGLKQKDLIQYFGSKEMVSQVLNKKRPLTLRMIKSLYQNFGISAEALLAF